MAKKKQKPIAWVHESTEILYIPKTGFAPLLFLEWLAQFNEKDNIINKVYDDGFSMNDVIYLKIVLNTTLTEINALVKYINLNL